MELHALSPLHRSISPWSGVSPHGSWRGGGGWGRATIVAMRTMRGLAKSRLPQLEITCSVGVSGGSTLVAPN